MVKRVSVGTFDAINAPVVREALADAGLTVEAVEVRQFTQLGYLRHQVRPRVDIQVAASEVEAARDVLARVEEEIAEALAAEALADPEARKSADDLRIEDEQAAARGREAARPRSLGIGVALGLLVPAAGPIYAGGLALALASLFGNLIAALVAFAAGFPHRLSYAALAALGAVRLLDAGMTAKAILEHNAALGRPEDKDGDGPHP